MVEATIPDTPGGRLMRAAYRPFMLQIAKEIDHLPDRGAAYSMYDGVAKLTANMIVTVVRSTAATPDSAHVLLLTLLDMVASEVTSGMKQPVDNKNAVLLQSTEGGMQ